MYEEFGFETPKPKKITPKRICSAAAILLLAFWIGPNIWSAIPCRLPTGDIITEGPLQTNTTRAPWKSPKGNTITPLADYKIQALLVTREKYSTTFDFAAIESQWDLGVVWGPIANKKILEEINLRQYGRYLRWSYCGQQPPNMSALKDPANPEKTPTDILAENIGNIHIVCSPEMNKKIKRLRTNQVVTLQGVLIEVRFAGQSTPWRSSLTRTDQGNHACEIMYLEQLTTP
jgi:hypothetical protein